MQILPSYRRPFLQRVIAALSLVGFLAAVVGVPVFEPAGTELAKDLSQPFPCQHSACGCRSAAMCWKACCCNTNKAKLAWAKKNGVKPPAFVEVAAAKEERTEKTAKATCCSTKESKESPVVATKSCCSKPVVAAKPVATSEATKELAADSSWRVTLVNTIAARQCQGLDQLWLIFSAAVPPPSMVEFNLEESISPLPETLAASLTSLTLLPATPPPKA
ncbi:hypothetical protein NA78x_004913 [Anatilimnocola sp. NA78]|uniref:hypothetical protein n=1 Tax=Anatilimnocola sp. NA78 TaxID=3415683 RepID=UPI003CE46DC9